MSNGIKILSILAVVTMAFSCCVAMSDASDADTSFTVTDTTGKTFSYTGPSEHVVVTGYAATLTLIDAGMADKIYATDQYGAVAFDDKGISRPSNIWNISYSGDNATFKSNLINAAQNGDFDKTKDTVVLTTFKTSLVGSDMNSGLRKELMDEDVGFAYIPFYGTITEYADIVNCVRDLENIVGSTAGLTANMESAYNSVTAAVASESKVDAIFIRYSTTNGWGVGVSGSIAGTLIETAGGNNVAKGAGSSTVYNESVIIELLRDNPDAIIFIDSPYFENGGTFEKFVDDLLGGNQGNHGLVKVLKTWNNYDPESAEGLTEIAHVLHPDAVEGTTELYFVSGNGGDNDSMIYIGIGAVAIIAAIGVFLFVRSRK